MPAFAEPLLWRKGYDEAEVFPQESLFSCHSSCDNRRNSHVCLPGKSWHFVWNFERGKRRSCSCHSNFSACAAFRGSQSNYCRRLLCDGKKRALLCSSNGRTLLYACIYADFAEIFRRADYGMVEHRACTNQCSSTCCFFCGKDAEKFINNRRIYQCVCKKIYSKR